MKKIILVALIVLVSFSVVYAQTVFSDEDLEKYNNKRDSFQVQKTESAINENQQKNNITQADPQQDRNSWCERGRTIYNRVIVAEQNVTRTEKTAKEAGTKTASDALSAADAAKAELDSAIVARQSLEDEAYRKYIPLGWLKCNFN